MSSHLAAIPPYVFWELDARRQAHRARGRTLIDLGIGSPDQPIPDLVVQAMRERASDRTLSGYPYFRAHPEYVEAVTRYLHERFAVSVDPVTQMMALAGSKEGIAELVMSHCNPGDVVLVPEVFYPVYARATQLVGVTPVFVPFAGDGSGMLELDAIAHDDLARARVMIINYPSNPTTAVASIGHLAQFVDFARQHKLLLISDLAYSELSFDGYRVPSVLEVPGAMDVAVELHSCSKSFNMAGVRIAFAAGNRAAIARLDQYRSNIGYGVATLSQLAGAAAFTHWREIVPPVVAEYRRRRDALVDSLNEHGWHVEAPNATMYLWLDIPAGVGDWEWVDMLMEEDGIVVTPGMAFGAAGKGKFRISLVRGEAELATVGRLLAQRL